MNAQANVMIIGGGITGLSAAYYLKKQFEGEGRQVRIQLVEQSASLGGRIHTMERDGFVIERGPDSFLARKMPIIDLTRELGLEGELVGTNPNAKKTYILHRGKLHRMPEGLVLGIPTEIAPFMKTGLISPLGKMRAAMDLVLPKRESTLDESLGHFLERRLGQEVLEHIAEPLLAGIYAGDTYSLSLQATFPQFQAMEQKHRSLILGMMANRRKTQEEAANLPAAGRNSVFMTYRKGLQTLVRGLLAALDGVELRTETPVSSVQRSESGYEVTFGDGSAERVDGLIVTTPIPQVVALLPQVPMAKALGEMDYVSVANVIMAFDAKDIAYKLDGSGFVVPRKEGRFITACTWTSSKWLHTAPQGKALLRCYVGRSGEQAWMQLADEEIVQSVRKDLRELMGIQAQPLFHAVTRLINSMPQYPVEHLSHIERYRDKLAATMPGVLVTGAGFHGVGLPDCIRQGKEAAVQQAEYIRTNVWTGKEAPVHV